MKGFGDNMNNGTPSVRVIGLCGRSGAGKTTVCKAFEKYGIKSVDTDKVYRELTLPKEDGTPSALVSSLACEFGGGIVNTDGSLNRGKLAAIVFGNGNEERLCRLNGITHWQILARTEEIIKMYAAKGAKGVIVDAPALFESGFDKKCDLIICVSAPDEILENRIIKRDSVNADDARKRLSSQMPEDELRRRSDFVIVNDGKTDIDEETYRVAELLNL